MRAERRAPLRELRDQGVEDILDAVREEELHLVARPSGTLRISFWLARGNTIRLIPARRAASTFSFTPPIGSTKPVRVISPVIAVSARAGSFV